MNRKETKKAFQHREGSNLSLRMCGDMEGNVTSGYQMTSLWKWSEIILPQGIYRNLTEISATI